MPTMPLFAADLGASGTQVGIVGGIFGYSAILIRLFTNDVRQLGKKFCFYVGLGISMLVTLSFVIFDSIGSVIVARFVQGFGFGLATTFAAALVLEVIPASRRGEGLGYFGLGSTVGMAIAPALGIFLYENFNSTVLFVTSALCILIAGVIVSQTDKISSAEKISASYGSISERFLARGTGRAAMLTILFSVAYGSVNTFIAMAAREANLPNAGFFFVIGTTFIFLSRPIGGKLFDTHGAFATLLPGTIFYTIALVMIFSAKSSATLLTAAIFHGIGAGFLLPALMTWMINSVKSTQRDAASATFYNMLDIGTGTGVLLLGTLSGTFGYMNLYKFVAVVMIFVLIVLLRTRSRRGF